MCKHNYVLANLKDQWSVFFLLGFYLVTRYQDWIYTVDIEFSLVTLWNNAWASERYNTCLLIQPFIWLGPLLNSSNISGKTTYTNYRWGNGEYFETNSTVFKGKPLGMHCTACMFANGSQLWWAVFLPLYLEVNNVSCLCMCVYNQQLVIHAWLDNSKTKKIQEFGQWARGSDQSYLLDNFQLVLTLGFIE